ncbi:hypothetical protein Pedsa_3177 [Pseudopedobacter saltans DSM 12145]|uniref:SusD/RagB family nutrient-binding outer membrane lipoprotein n=1 Tax=Pseudopedobacter saltans (strain ATCC 51119 / DSM 12145 / JCM 21818 / CCUG 39354 / LMG 10337 / NBRC 100064 / NCIMB 13643) TaxID=762903 RepID=F0SB86_PSESL|nr:SusD/RagB family nutrient-binding outer membrane lipoprotein [Pseudopedobacter saltans]ADY53713.1 hypothetical protein Pedsa_3177 [Pseudopedobacter saltans DSM 12145]
MKKNFRNILFLLLGSSVTLLPSCKDGFSDINTDPNTTTDALPEQLLAPALVNTLNYNMIRSRNFNNELMQVTVDMSDAEGRVFRYDIRNTWSDYTWNGWYAQLTNFKDLYITAKDPINNNRSYMAISLICQAWIYSLLTDTYGDVPFSESNKAKTEQIYEAKFDSQKDIYFGMFAMLEEANSLLQGPNLPAINAASDPVFSGNLTRWRRFGNSLYLRMLMRISGKSEVSGEVIAKIKEIIDTKNADYPKMTSLDDSAILRWTGIAPYTSPFIGVRTQDFSSPAIADFFISHLVAWGDPRIDISTYGSSGINRWAIAQGPGGFAGVDSGYEPGTPVVKQSYFYSTTSARSLQNDPLTGMIMNYAELQFIYAEAAFKGWINGNPATFYKNGVINSIKQWIPLWPEANIDTYLLNSDMQWSDNDSDNDKMEKIHLQKYYALFFNDLQQWFEYRRTGHPVLPKGPGLKNGKVMPARLNYPVYVQSTNPTNYKKAIAAQGEDKISTEVWWQKP